MLYSKATLGPTKALYHLTIEVVLGYKYSPPLGLVNTYTGVAAVIAKSALLLSTMALFPASLTRTLDCVLGVFGTCQA